MKTRLFTAVAACSGLVLVSCEKADLAPPATPAKGAQAPAATEPAAETVRDTEPSEAEKKLASQVQELEARELALQQQMEDERLAAADAEIAKEQELLQKEREAWALEQQLADAKTAADEASAAAEESQDASAQDVPVSTFAANDYQTFYDDLDPLGSWYESPDYGYVWQPSIAISDVNWRPYTRGRWACADQGWTWCSDEPFGWACYHYGRWCKARGRGWVWVPGDQWAPAWVSWRKTDSHIGWCPLPPETVYDRDFTYGSTVDQDCGIHPGCYVFMPVRQFDQPVFSHCEVPSVCLTIYNTSVNITHLVIRRHRVECHGPQYDWIAGCVRRPIPRYTLACDSNPRDHRRTSALIKGNQLHCFAPKVYAPWNSTLRPARTKAALASADIVRGESGVPGKLVSRFRQERLQRGKEAENLTGTVGQKIMEHQKRLVALEKTREALRQQSGDAAKPNGPSIPGREIAGRPGRQTGGDAPIQPGRAPKPPGVVIAGNPANSNTAETPNSRADGPTAKAAENARLIAAKEELARQRALRESTQPDVRKGSAPVAPNPAVAADGGEQRSLVETREQLNARRDQLAKLRAEREAAGNSRPQPSTVVRDDGTKEKVTGSAARVRDDAARREQAAQNDSAKEQLARQRAALEEQRRAADSASRDLEKQTAERTALEEKRRLQQEAQNKTTKEQLAQQRAALEEQRRAADATSREADRQNSERAALEERRRQQQEAQNKATKDQLAQQRATLEEQRRAADAASREADRQRSERAALEEKRRQQQEAQERTKAQLAQERAALEQQRRQAEEQAKAERQAREQAAAQQREAMQRQAAEQAARQREAVENQRRQAEEQNRQENMRRQAEERAREQQERRQAEENNRRQAEENNRRQAEENNRRQAAEESRRQADQRAKEAADQNNKRGR